MEELDTIEYDYPTFHLSMDCFGVRLLRVDLVLKEHEAAKWLSADVKLIEKIKNNIICYYANTEGKIYNRTQKKNNVFYNVV